MPGARRKARCLALQVLYEVDLTGHDPDHTLEALLADEALPSEAVQYARDLVHGVLDARQRIDSVIAQTAPAWPVPQIAAVDRNVLRLAIFEILVNNQVPVRAAINEAVELAKRFGSDNSARFVNGVLASVSSLAAR